jgi:predicted Zn-ribbon and HTH transcriptional regulator
MSKMTLMTRLCTRCGHEWIARQLALPRRCPRCRSPYWHKRIERPTTSAAQRKRWGR